MNMKILVTGATGLIGKRLSRRLISEGHKIVILSRRPENVPVSSQTEVFGWNAEKSAPPAEALAGIDAVVHLAGEPVAAARWTEEQKRKIRNSRVLGTKNLVEGLRKTATRPGVMVSGSAVGIYGSRGDETLPESAVPGTGFLVDICREWEAEADEAQALGIRVAQVRIGVVLSSEGGALEKMLLPFKLGIGGRLSSGRQWFPWIHIDDIVGILHFALSNQRLKGPVNGVAPGIVTNAEFTKQLASELNRPVFLPVPEFALRIMMGEMANVVLASQRVIPEVAMQAGYRFAFPDLREALHDLLRKESSDLAKAG
jgi:hypothetical protein